MKFLNHVKKSKQDRISRLERETNTEGMSFKQLEQRIYVETEKVLHNLVSEFDKIKCDVAADSGVAVNSKSRDQNEFSPLCDPAFHPPLSAINSSAGGLSKGSSGSASSSNQKPTLSSMHSSDKFEGKPHVVLPLSQNAHTIIFTSFSKNECVLVLVIAIFILDLYI